MPFLKISEKLFYRKNFTGIFEAKSWKFSKNYTCKPILVYIPFLKTSKKNILSQKFRRKIFWMQKLKIFENFTHVNQFWFTYFPLKKQAGKGYYRKNSRGFFEAKS